MGTGRRRRVLMPTVSLLEGAHRECNSAPYPTSYTVRLNRPRSGVLGTAQSGCDELKG
jgi:hypothetical protein